jgi:A/G-specific adenine glycosylase
LCNQCPLIKNCKSFKKNDFEIVKNKKKKIDKFFKLKVYKKGNQYLLIKNNKFSFLKNFKIFPMYEISKKDNLEKNLNFKISNMNMNITIKFNKIKGSIPNSSWIDSTKLDSYILPTFTKKIFSYLKKNI